MAKHETQLYLKIEQFRFNEEHRKNMELKPYRAVPHLVSQDGKQYETRFKVSGAYNAALETSVRIVFSSLENATAARFIFAAIIEEGGWAYYNIINELVNQVMVGEEVDVELPESIASTHDLMRSVLQDIEISIKSYLDSTRAYLES